jgi:hypothetical protein
MGNKVSQRAIAHLGIQMPATQVPQEVGRAVIAEAMRCRRTTSWLIADIIQDWYEAVYLPSQEQAKKKPTG